MPIVIDPNITLDSDDSAFIRRLELRLTRGQQLPYNVPKSLIIDIIQDAARTAHIHYTKALERKFMYLQYSDVTNEQITSTKYVGSQLNYVVKMDPRVRAIFEVYETNERSMPSAQELVDNIQLLNHASPYGQSMMGINNSLYIIEATTRLIEAQNYESIFKTAVPVSYNRNSGLLQIKKDLSATNTNLMIECLYGLDLKYLYNDTYFFNYCLAKCKQELRAIVGTHQNRLAGETTLNIEELCTGSDKDVEILTYWKASGGLGSIIKQR